MIFYKKVLGWNLDIITGIKQPQDHLDTWIGFGGFEYGFKKTRIASKDKGYYIFLYYGSKYTQINIWKRLK